MTDLHTLIEQLVDELDCRQPLDPDTLALMARARAALAEPQGEGPTDEELLELWKSCDFGWDPLTGTVLPPHPAEYARAVLARWGRPALPLPSAEVE
jgi:hypothetical protein